MVATTWRVPPGSWPGPGSPVGPCISTSVSRRSSRRCRGRARRGPGSAGAACEDSRPAPPPAVEQASFSTLPHPPPSALSPAADHVAPVHRPAADLPERNGACVSASPPPCPLPVCPGMPARRRWAQRQPAPIAIAIAIALLPSRSSDGTPHPHLETRTPARAGSRPRRQGA